MTEPVATTSIAALTKGAGGASILSGIPVIIVVLAVCAALANKSDDGLSQEHKDAFEDAMLRCKDPGVLRNLADAFEARGYDEPYAYLLRQRADLRDRKITTPEIRKERKRIFQWAISLKDPATVTSVAEGFRAKGCYGMAAQLDEYATGLKAQPNPDDYRASDKEAAQ